jgi:hypothetical protein
MRFRTTIAAASRFWLFLAVFFVVGAVAQPAAAGTAENVTGWAWSGTIGWVAMNCTALGDCTPDFGVTISSNLADPTRGDLSGYAWSETAGWICFGATCPGTTPEGGAPYAQYRASWNGKTDQVFGWAKVLSFGDAGWISLNCDRDAGSDECAAANYYVVVNLDDGTFLKPAEPNGHWAWGGTDIMVGAGWMDLSAVSTGWVPARLGRINRPEGIYEPDTSGLPGTHLSSFDVSFVGFWGGGGQRVECDFLLPDGASRTAGRDLTGPIRDGLTSVSYTVQGSDAVEANKIWYVSACRIADLPGATACAADATCTPEGICDETLGKCRTVVASSSRKLPVYTHGNDWSGLEAGEDQYTAVKCFAGFPNNYLKNAAQCDFAGDASFSLAMRRGMPIEGNCADGLDNDGNGQVDCADRYCQGISYRCQTLARTACVRGEAGDGLVDCTDGGHAAGDLCCGNQPTAAGAATSRIVDGLECRAHDLKDGYFDCACVGAAQFDASSTDDCYAPGAAAGDYCCDADDAVEKL